MVPDYGMISEIVLYSYGYTDAKKVNGSCRLCIAERGFIAVRKASLLRTRFFRHPQPRHDYKSLKTQSIISVSKAVRYWSTPLHRSLDGNHV